MGLGRKNDSLIFIRFCRLPYTVHDDTCIGFYGCFVCWFGCSFLETVSRRPGWPKILDLPASISQVLELQVYSTRFSCIQSCLPAQVSWCLKLSLEGRYMLGQRLTPKHHLQLCVQFYYYPNYWKAMEITGLFFQNSCFRYLKIVYLLISSSKIWLLVGLGHFACNSLIKKRIYLTYM